jgi:hypothetical protein
MVVTALGDWPARRDMTAAQCAEHDAADKQFRETPHVSEQSLDDRRLEGRGIAGDVVRPIL